MIIHPLAKITGKLIPPGDKSISHRALIFGAFAEGTTKISGLSQGLDVQATRQALQTLEYDIPDGRDLEISGRSITETEKSKVFHIDCANSGTTLRLLAGLCAGQRRECYLVGDTSLNLRPMSRISMPLRLMGADLSLSNEQFAPLRIHPNLPLKGITYNLPVASAQVKGCLLIAGLFASGELILGGKIASRDHTERLLIHFGVELETDKDSIKMVCGQKLKAAPITVPGDPSSAAFFATAAAVLEGSTLSIEKVMLNPTRIGFYKILEKMGVAVSYREIESHPEPTGNILVSKNELLAFEINADEVSYLVDEIPLLAVLASQCQGLSKIHGVGELRFKESDRLLAIQENLNAMGVQVSIIEDSLTILGPQKLKGAIIDPKNDHRIAMAFAIAGLFASSPSKILNPEIVDVSYPDFFKVLMSLVS